MADVSAKLRAWAAPATVAACVLVFAAGSSSVAVVNRDVRNARWVVLGLLCAVALALASRVRHATPVLRFLPFPGMFVGLALLSSAWSPDLWLSFLRAASVALLFSAAAALAHAADADRDLPRRLLVAAGLGAVLVVWLGYGLLVVDHAAAVQQASSQSPWRFRGFGENPNTIPILAALALPIVGWRTIVSRGSTRLLWVFAGASLLSTSIMTESRGGLVAAFVGLSLVLGVLVPGRSAKAASIAVVAALCWGGVVLRQIEQPPLSPVAPVVPGQVGGGGGGTPGAGSLHPKLGYATPMPARQDEIGNPLIGGYQPTTAGSGRVAEWEGVLEQIRVRPLLGYGFGTETRVFVDRWYFFDGGSTENSFLGILLQLGIVGLLSLLGLGLVLVWRGTVAVRTAEPLQRQIAVVGLGVLVAAAALMMIQSYAYSVGNVGSVTLWLTLFLLAAVAFAPKRGVDGR